MIREFTKDEIVQIVFDDLIGIYSDAKDKEAQKFGRAMGPQSHDLLNFRSRNIGVMCAAHHLSLPSETLLKNAKTLIFTRIEGEDELKKAIGIRFLSDEQKEILKELKQDEIMFIQKSIWDSAIICKVEPVAEEKLTEEERRAIMKPVLESINWKPGRKFEQGFVSDNLTENDASLKTEGGQAKDKDSKSTPDERLLACNAHAQPRVPLTEWYKRFKWGAQKGTTKSRSGVKKGFWELLEINIIGGPGHEAKYIALTDFGRQIFQLPDRFPSGSGGRQSVEHRFIKEVGAEILEGKGYKIQVEPKIKGKAPDLLAEKDGQKYAVEVVESTIHWEHNNIKKDIENCGVKGVVLVTKDLKSKEKLIEALANNLEPAFNSCYAVCKLSELNNCSDLEEFFR